MLRQQLHEFALPTRGRGLYEITGEVGLLVKNSDLHTGLATLHLRHTSASLLIQENADPEVRRDLERFFERLCPEGDTIFEHTAEGLDDMPAHVRAALTGVNLSIPIAQGRLALGTWQGLFVWEHRRAAHRRQVVLHLLGE
jgi:secondary thiamine-phosphate synthase enzyme